MSPDDGDDPAGAGAPAPADPAAMSVTDLVDAGGVSQPCGEAEGCADGSQLDDGQHDRLPGAGAYADGYADGCPSSAAEGFADGCLAWSSWRNTGPGCLWFWPHGAAGEHSRHGKGVSGQSVTDVTAAARPQRAAGGQCHDGKRQGRQRDSDDGLAGAAAGAGGGDAGRARPGGENVGVDFFECESKDLAMPPRAPARGRLNETPQLQDFFECESKDLAAAYEVLGIPEDDSSSSGVNCG